MKIHLFGLIISGSAFFSGCSAQPLANPSQPVSERAKPKAVSPPVNARDYTVRTSKSPTGMGYITYLRWDAPYPDGTENIKIKFYAHDKKRNGRNPKTIAGFGNAALAYQSDGPKRLQASAESRIIPYWSKDGSVFAILVKEHTYFAYDFRKDEATEANLWGPSTPKSKRIQALLARRGGKIRVSFSKPRPVSFQEFQSLPKDERLTQ